MTTDNAAAIEEPNAPPPSDPPADDPSQDPPADPPSGDDPPADPPVEGEDPPADDPPKSRRDERISELVAERNAVTEYAEYWRRKALEGITPPKSETEAQEEPAPTLDQFGGDAARWSTAYAKWTDKAIETRTAKAVEQFAGRAAQDQSRRQVNAQWSERVAEYAKAHPEAVAIINNPSLPVTEHMTKVIVSSEKGPELAVHLGTNPAVAARISRLDPIEQAAALGRIEATLSAPPPPPPKKKTTNAPPPPTPINGGAAPGINLETCSIDDYLAARLGRK